MAELIAICVFLAAAVAVFVAVVRHFSDPYGNRKKRDADFHERFAAAMKRDGPALKRLAEATDRTRERNDYLAKKLREDHPDDEEYARKAKSMGLGRGTVKRNGGDDFSPFVIGAVFGAAASEDGGGSSSSGGGSCGASCGGGDL